MRHITYHNGAWRCEGSERSIRRGGVGGGSPTSGLALTADAPLRCRELRSGPEADVFPCSVMRALPNFEMIREESVPGAVTIGYHALQNKVVTMRDERRQADRKTPPVHAGLGPQGCSLAIRPRICFLGMPAVLIFTPVGEPC
jgi:hypothetical protein